MILVFSRILEKIVHDQVYEYLKASKVLIMTQSAFQRLCSTITSLIDSTDYWYENIDHKQLNLAIFLDLRKAFDTVDHKILLEKTEEIRYSRTFQRLVSIIPRKQKVVLCRKWS